MLVATQPRTPNPRGAGGRLRDDLVAAARTLLLAPQPFSPISLRAVAKSVGVSPTAVYAHFSSVETLIEAVIDDQSDLLAAALDAPGLPEDATDRVVALAQRYVEWGVAHPGGYQLLFESADRLGHRVGPGTPGWSMIDSLSATLEGVLDVSPDAAVVVAVRGWVGLHGITSLRIHKAALPWPAPADQEAAAFVEALLAAAR